MKLYSFYNDALSSKKLVYTRIDNKFTVLWDDDK